MLALLLATCAALPAGAAEGGQRPTDNGERLYLLHCAACHGRSGRGDGPSASIFTVHPRDLREGFLGKYPADALVRRILDGRALPLALDPAALKARARDVETLVAYMQRLPDVDWRKAQEGEALYTQRCESCHGRFGHPPEKLPEGVRKPDDLSDAGFQRSLDDEELLVAARHGREGMPALIPRLGEDDARVVLRYVRLLSPGFETYSQYCANCHGEDGRPAGSFAESSLRLPAAAFDRAYFENADREDLRAKVWHMAAEHEPSMPHFRETISEAEAHSIIEYLKKTE